MKQKFFIAYIFFIFLSIDINAVQTVNQLTKMFHHKGIFSDKLVCYFTNEPICNRLPQSSLVPMSEKARDSLVFFMPRTMANKETLLMIQKIQKARKSNYSVFFQHVSKPLKGIKVTILYDSSEIMCECERFNAITQDKGLVFTFHHKKVLDTLNNKTGSVLRYAYNTEKPRIILDFGHGGHDDGTIGYGDLKEKTINLQVGSKVAQLLKKKGFHVLLTRNTDRFVPLDRRTSAANNYTADLFVSIHSNGAQSKKASGIETYWMGKQSFKPCLGRKYSSLDRNISNVVLTKDALSKLLAQQIHNNVVVHAQTIYKGVVDRKVKESVAQVLLGTEMPSTLIELGFLSNQKEGMLLSSPAYQNRLASGICKGIESYLQKRNQI